ncbi:NUDIX domain-containing protein [Bacillus sp. RG28]|uniref:NUDIX domain-containing protein n=1 Tax=Gottfriedia endophytica TaxID=2820819 RepID=A0A940SKA4_9BACI|nr:NUDIX domain-containing protein [Gottfriedia endophytica]MBP0726271.1 NUDIX domain-containing protein [Gottfriedia endophytica]
MGYIENLRKVIGKQPLILVGSVVAVIDDEGRILLQKKTNGIWNIPGGLLELEESTEEAARREVFEETGIKIGELKLVNVFSGKQFFNKLANGDEFYPVTIAYLSRDIKGGALKADGIETLEAKYFNMNDLPNEVSPLVNKLVRYYNEMVS